VRAGLRTALLLCAVGVALLLWSLLQVWVAVPYEEGLTLGGLMREATGKELAPGALPATYVGLAGIAALVAVRGWWRVLIGALVSGAGIAAGVVLAPLTSGEEVGRRAFRVFAQCDTSGCGLSGPQPTAAGTPWVWVALAGAVLVVLAGLLVVVRGRRWPGLSSRYERPAPEAVIVAAEPVTDKGVWDALDRGDDPTA
jgi:uncharacterized membrane protein (TIGR02234 family)